MRWVFLLFFFSGFSALVYEVTWARKLSLIFGTDTYAISTVIAVFFAGLALGSFLLGRIVDRKGSKPLFLYGLLELGIGVYAVATPWIFKLIESIQISFWRAFEPSFGGFSLVAFALSVLGLIIPTLLMGGTLPVISKAWVTRETGVGRDVGSLYAVNTAGAVVGVFAAGFLLIAAIGVHQTIWAAAGISLLVGVIALGISRMDANERIKKQERISALAPISSKFAPISVLLAFGLAGFAAIALEVLWTRVLVMVVGGSVYAFSLVLIAFLIGIAAGSAVMAKFTD